jgi:hypothetical protein
MGASIGRLTRWALHVALGEPSQGHIELSIPHYCLAIDPARHYFEF